MTIEIKYADQLLLMKYGQYDFRAAQTIAGDVPWKFFYILDHHCHLRVSHVTANAFAEGNMVAS